MSSNFRIRHGQPDWITGGIDPIQVIASNYSTRSVGHHYPPKVHKSDHKDFSLIAQYTDRFYAQRHGTLYRVSPQSVVPALDASGKTGAHV